MRVLITGGTGSVGNAATERLVAVGWDVLVVGRRAGMDVPGAGYAVCDVTCFDDLCEKMAGCDAVVHLAAIASPMRDPGPEVLRVNVMGTVNVFEAAAKTGVRRVAQASSINAFGCWWGVVDLDHVRYFPIDEEHPTYTTDPYSFSKEVIEDVGRYYWRREGITSVALRLPWVHPREHQYSQEHRQRMQSAHNMLDEVAALPAAQRLARLAEVREKAMAYRRQRPMEPGTTASRSVREVFTDDPFARMYLHSRPNFWAFVDERDSAQAIEKSLTADCPGSEVLFINDAHNSLMYDTERLLGVFFPEVAGRRRPVEGCGSVVSIDKARALIGFEPEYSVAAGGAD